MENLWIWSIYLIFIFSDCIFSQEDKSTLLKYKEAVEKRLHILEEQGYVYAYETI